jgi:transcription antitermination factor NusG
MTLWAAYTPHGMEFDLVEDCEVLGIEAKAPRKVEAVRTGNKRWPEARVTPYLGNYVFVWADTDQWHWLKEIRYVRDIMGIIPQWEPKIRAFIDAVEADFTTRMAEIERAQRIMQDKEATKEARREAVRLMQAYQPGDMLEVITGPFAGQLVAFGAMVERANAMMPEIEAQMAGLKVRFDPLSVRKAS